MAIFCRRFLVLLVTNLLLVRAGDLGVVGRVLGRPTSDVDQIVDQIIAATAIDRNMVLVRSNTEHFSWIPDISLQEWRPR